MKLIFVFLMIVVLFCLPFISLAQSDFSADEYLLYLQENQDMTNEQLLSQYAPKNPYYKEIAGWKSIADYSYLDSVIIKYNLTAAELDLLKKNHFVVSERLNFESFAWALNDIYKKDLPVFVTTDAILHALHSSYDRLLIETEIAILKPKLHDLLLALYQAFPGLVDKYNLNPRLHDALGDVDLYITIAMSLLMESLNSPQYISATQVNAVWEAIQSEQLVFMPLFTKDDRKIDFSQFTLRGHYTQYEELGPYFKCMMWLGRIDFWLTPPPDFDDKEQIRRMNLGAVMLNELIDMANVRHVLNDMDEIIEFMVGQSDNLTPEELKNLVLAQGIDGADDLLDDSTYDAFQEALNASDDYGQKILSNFFIMNPFSSVPDNLPISFRLSGQRFIIDSYIFSNVVYDRIIYQGKKIWRPMPDPLDAMFVLGNNDALPLLKGELDRYKYALQLSALRYLVDAYDEDFWDQSLYNVWLQAIRLLIPPEDLTSHPLFMNTVAWHQQKLNTQLASWTELRHDNLLYAKQSYTGGGACSFPHAFVEPYPAFYRQIGAFAKKASSFFTEIALDTTIETYFRHMHDTMTKLEIIAQKELQGQTLSNDELLFLQDMFTYKWCGSGGVILKGWYADLFYYKRKVLDEDYIIADVHTQPTLANGAIVGRLLHVGVGKVNLGIFLADSPSDDFRPMAYVGPVMSYYEKITKNFDRLTDERWAEFVKSDSLPLRPDWVNVYLTDSTGSALAQGRELPGILYTKIAENCDMLPLEFNLAQNYPNPFNPTTVISYTVGATPTSPVHVELSIYNILGQKVSTLVSEKQKAGTYEVEWDATGFASGIYLYSLQTDKGFSQTRKLVLLK